MSVIGDSRILLRGLRERNVNRVREGHLLTVLKRQASCSTRGWGTCWDVGTTSQPRNLGQAGPGAGLVEAAVGGDQDRLWTASPWAITRVRKRESLTAELG